MKKFSKLFFMYAISLSNYYVLAGCDDNFEKTDTSNESINEESSEEYIKIFGDKLDLADFGPINDKSSESLILGLSALYCAKLAKEN